MISGWDEPETEHAELGHLAAVWTDLGLWSKSAGDMITADHISFLDE